MRVSLCCLSIGRSVGVPPSRQSVWRLCIVLASVAQLEYLPRLSGRLCPRFVLASVAQLEYLPPVSQSVRAPLYRPRIGRSVRVPPSRQSVLASVAQLEYLPPVSQPVRAPLYRPRIGRSVGVPPSSVRAPPSSLRPRVGRSVGVPPSRQSVCRGTSVSSSHRLLSWSTSLVCQGASVLA